MSIVEKMVAEYNAAWDAARDVTAANVASVRIAAMTAALTATGLTEAQLEGLASGELVVVPVEPTTEMLVRGARAADDFMSQRGPYPRTKAVYRAMLAAKEG